MMLRGQPLALLNVAIWSLSEATSLVVSDTVQHFDLDHPASLLVGLSTQQRLVLLGLLLLSAADPHSLEVMLQTGEVKADYEHTSPMLAWLVK